MQAALLSTQDDLRGRDNSWLDSAQLVWRYRNLTDSTMEFDGRNLSEAILSWRSSYAPRATLHDQELFRRGTVEASGTHCRIYLEAAARVLAESDQQAKAAAASR